MERARDVALAGIVRMAELARVLSVRADVEQRQPGLAETAGDLRLRRILVLVQREATMSSSAATEGRSEQRATHSTTAGE